MEFSYISCNFGLFLVKRDLDEERYLGKFYLPQRDIYMGNNLSTIFSMPQKMIFRSFFKRFSIAHRHNSTNRFFPDIISVPNFSSNIALRLKEIWQKSLEPFLRKRPICTAKWSHFVYFSYIFQHLIIVIRQNDFSQI